MAGSRIVESVRHTHGDEMGELLERTAAAGTDVARAAVAVHTVGSTSRIGAAVGTAAGAELVADSSNGNKVDVQGSIRTM